MLRIPGRRSCDAKTMPEGGSRLLLVTHVALRDGPRGLQIDDQTAAGLAQWCRHFDRVTFYGIADNGSSSNSTTWVDVEHAPFASRCSVRALPRAYRPLQMLRSYRHVRRALALQVREHDHLCFTVGGFVGDWPAVAARESARQNRRYSAWIDRVEPSITRDRQSGSSLLRRLAAEVMIIIGEAYTRIVLQGSSVALLQGRDTFDHYSRWAREPHCTYDTHTTVADQIGPRELDRKLARIAREDPLEILYVGRAVEMKGPLDWLATLSRINAAAVPFHATWVGDGSQLEIMRARIIKLGLTGRVDLAGFQGDRRVLLDIMRQGDLFLFCHKTPESPRSLIEALVSGVPLVGYGSAYPRGLVASGGGRFARQGDVEALADLVIDLHRDRAALGALVREAAESGLEYNEDRVYAFRAGLMARA